MKTWLITVTIAGRDAGSWSAKSVKPWTAIYHVLMNLKFSADDELRIVCKQKSESQGAEI